MRAAWVAALASLFVLVSGCASNADGQEDGASDAGLETGGAPPPETMSFDFGLGAAVGTPVLGTILPIDDQRKVSFEVAEGHALLVATATFECDAAPTCDLDVELRRGEQNVVTAGFGDSPITLTLEAPEGGRYTFWAFPSGGGSVVVGMQGTLTVELS